MTLQSNLHDYKLVDYFPSSLHISGLPFFTPPDPPSRSSLIMSTITLASFPQHNGFYMAFGILLDVLVGLHDIGIVQNSKKKFVQIMKIILLWSIFHRSRYACFTGFKVRTNNFFLKFFLAIVFHLGMNKKKWGLWILYRRILLGKNGPKSPYFKEIKFKFAIFRPYNMLSKYSGIPKKILLSSRERPNGLWLRLLVNDLPVHLPHKIGD